MDGLVSSMKAAMPDLEKVVGKATDTILGMDAKPTVDLKARAGRGTAATAGNRDVHIHVTFTGLVTDKVGTAREIKKILTDYDKLVGA